MYQGDIRLGDTIYFHFTTRRFTTGAPFTLAGTPSVAAYPQDSTTEITAGITLAVDLDSRTGLNSVKIIATSGNGYATATNYSVVITAGTVDSVSVVGEVVGSFSIEARSALMPTVAARTLDVSSTGEGGLDWANIGSPTTTQNLSGTSTKAIEPTVAGRTLDVTATGAAGIDWGNVENPTTAQNLSATNIDPDQVVASVTGAVGSVTGAVGSVTGSVGSVTGNVGGNVVGSVASVTGNVGGNLVGNVNGNVVGSVGSVTGNVGGNVVGSVASVTNPVTVGTNNDKTGYAIGVGGIASTSFAANAIDSAALDNSAGQDIADRLLLRNLATGSDGGRTVQSGLRSLRNRVIVSGAGNVEVYEEDDVTLAWSGVATRTAGTDPITEIDPT